MNEMYRSEKLNDRFLKRMKRNLNDYKLNLKKKFFFTEQTNFPEDLEKNYFYTEQTIYCNNKKYFKTN